MPYDDDSSSSRWREDDDWATLFERGTLSASKIIVLVQSLHLIAGERSPDQVGMTELSTELAQRGLSSVPFDTVVRALDATGPVPADADPLSHITLRDVKYILGR